ncbi:MAG TPA: malto-oligosyltrehalose synthase [Acidimicrobiales bacterium]|nr:malto-oligosyltrehalose synthase [Acidimicrobiales bacterium]
METPPLGSTYRLQLFDVGFAGARALVGYLAALGIETLYVSPIFAAVPGSTHGYDVIDHHRLDPALGTADEFEELLSELDRHHMRILIDMVPNHMATDRSNQWWWDVMRSGQESEFAACFDIDWSQHGGRVLIPTLSRPLAELIATAQVVRRDRQAMLRLDGQQFPLHPGPTKSVADALRRQHYRPAYWRLSRDEGNYRRFFDIDGLVGVRVEDRAVFDRVHSTLIGLNKDDRVAGWRVDHIDGLTDPTAYLKRLATALHSGRRTRPVVLVEKIVARDEHLPTGWATDGTTGYEFADLVGGLFVDGGGLHVLEQLGAELAACRDSYAEMEDAAKREVAAQSFPALLERLAHLAQLALDQREPGHDLSRSQLVQAIAELTTALDVYRTYFDAQPATAPDVARLQRASKRALASMPSDDVSRAMRALTTGLQDASGPWREVAQRWQQLTGAVMAKGVEDTATYRYPGLLGHAEVGSNPADAAATPEQFHRLARRQTHPMALNATSTHDSKRSEDARARLYAISEMPEEWSRLVRRWHDRFHELAEPGPDGHDQWLTYQTVAALWPLQQPPFPAAHLRRVRQYLVKAAREAKRNTSWSDPNSRYERALTSFAGHVTRDESFRRDMTRFMKRIGPAAAANALSMVVLKAMSRGVPDFYQGTELWDFSLTDPDNRRPVDFAERAALLADLPAPDASAAELTRASQSMLRHWQDGRIKLHLTRSLLHLRRAHPELFAEGSYQAVTATGPRGDHIVALARRRGPQWVIAVVPRLMVAVVGPGSFALGPSTWGSSALRLPAHAPSLFADVVSGASVSASGGQLKLAQCLHHLPIAVLINDP